MSSLGLMTKIYYEYKLEWSALLLILGVFSTTLGTFGLVPDKSPSPIASILDGVGDWYLWLLLIGPFLLIFGLWYMLENTKHRKEFEELIDTTSKAKFVKNLDRIEELAWILGRNYQVRVVDKKSEFRIKKR